MKSWKVSEYTGDVIADEDDKLICVVLPVEQDSAEKAKRARLIAAAPMMLYELRNALNGIEYAGLFARRAGDDSTANQYMIAVKKLRKLIDSIDGVSK